MIVQVINHPKRLQRRRQKYVQQSKWQQEPPAKIHQLIKPKPRQRAPQPDIEEKKEHYFAEEVEHTEPRKLPDKRAVPTAQKQQRKYA